MARMTRVNMRRGVRSEVVRTCPHENAIGPILSDETS